MKVTAETLTYTDILIERGNATCDAAQANRIRYACELALSGIADEQEIARVVSAINARAKGGK